MLCGLLNFRCIDNQDYFRVNRMAVNIFGMRLGLRRVIDAREGDIGQSLGDYNLWRTQDWTALRYGAVTVLSNNQVTSVKNKFILSFSKKYQPNIAVMDRTRLCTFST